jgi:multiple sugar transport system substrate-binding protein
MKRNVKFILALALSLLMLAGVVACAAPEAPAPEPEAPAPEAPAPEPGNDDDEEVEAPPANDGVARITYMFWGDEAEIENVQNTLDAFNAAHPHIYVSPWPVDRDDITEILTTLAAAGELPDTGFMTEEMAINWARAGFIQAPECEGDTPRDIISFRWEDEVVAYSSCIVQLVFYYNRDLFDAAGVDYAPKTAADAWSWDEFVDVARTLTIDANGNNAHSPDFDRNNIEQYGFYLEPAVFQLEVWALSNGGGFFDPDDWSNVIINEPEAAEAIQRIADLYLVYGVMPRWGSLDGTIDAWFLEHNVAMAVNGSWSIGVWLDDAMNVHGLNYSVGVLPSMGRSVTIATAGLAVQYYGSAYPEAAAEFLAWFAATENKWGLIYGGIWMPRYEEWFLNEDMQREWADNENHPPFEDFQSAVINFSMTNAVSAGWHWVPGYDAFLPELATALADVWSGDATAQEALEAARPAFVRAIGAE